MTRKEELNARLKDIIINTCNKIGCKDCDLKWDDTCQAVAVQNEIYELKVKNEEN